MNRLKLVMDDLKVETFPTASDGREVDYLSGPSEPSWCRTCEGDPTCYTINCC